MKKVTKKRKPRTKSRLKIRTTRRSPSGHLLVIECDSPTLDKQGLAIGTRAVQLLNPLFPAKNIQLLRTSADDRVAGEFASIIERHNRFKTVLLVGHSNPQGLQLAAETFVQWPVLAKWLAPFEPKSILLAACGGARFEGAKALFEGLKTLRDLYGSPIELTVQQTTPLALATMTLLTGNRLPKDLNGLIQAANFIVTRGLFYHWSRDEVLNKQNIQAVVWTQFADILKAFPV